MITVKAFNKNLCCMGFQYRVGEEYEMPADKVKICERGFHASAHCDISETISYYPDVANNRYCLVDIHVVDKEADKVVGDKIRILKELSFEECIKYDRTGKWCHRYAYFVEDKNKIKKLQDRVIEKDKTGKLCYLFALDIKCVDIEKLQNAVIEKDKTGDLCYKFALDVEGSDIEKLQDAVIEKDIRGIYCYWFAKDIEGANIKKLQDAVIEKDETGYWCYWFAEDVEGADADNILQKMREKFGETSERYIHAVVEFSKRSERVDNGKRDMGMSKYWSF